MPFGGLSDGMDAGFFGGSSSDADAICRRSPTSTECIHASMRADGVNPYGPIQNLGQSPDVEWANPNCTRIPCAVKDQSQTLASNTVPIPPRRPSGPQPFASAEAAQAARDEAVRLGIDADSLVVLPDNTVLQQVGPGRYSTMGLCSGGPCSGMPQSSTELDSQFIAAREAQRRRDEAAADAAADDPPAGDTKSGGMNASNLPGDGGGQSLNPDRPDTTGTGKGSGGQTAGNTGGTGGTGGTTTGDGRQDGNLLGSLSDSITGDTPKTDGTGSGDAELKPVIKVAGSTIAKPKAKLGSETFEFNAVNKAADAAMGVFQNAPVTTNAGGVDNLNVIAPKPTQVTRQE
jgi:hypothetical protein